MSPFAVVNKYNQPWVREPVALELIVKLRGLQVGDWVIESGPREEAWQLNQISAVEAIHHFYDKSLTSEGWTLTGWLRPK